MSIKQYKAPAGDKNPGKSYHEYLDAESKKLKKLREKRMKDAKERLKNYKAIPTKKADWVTSDKKRSKVK